MEKAIFSIVFFIFVTSVVNSSYADFEQEQRSKPRVKVAINEKDELLRELFEDKEASYPPERIFLRIFKKEKSLELWAQNKNESQFKLIKSYPICATSGALGPKRREGDGQIPEGFYYVNRFNPWSSFYLSLGLNYPNRSDWLLAGGENPGSDIFIHGSCVTVGCITITDPFIKEIYWLAVQTKSNGQLNIPVHIFPTKLDNDRMTQLNTQYKDNLKLLSFWENLKQGYDFFDKFKDIPTIRVNSDGTYEVPASPDHKTNLYLQTPYIWGDDVISVQKKLSQIGFAVGIDGIYGKSTAAAVKIFQENNALKADGIVGPRTRAALGL